MFDSITTTLMTMELNSAQCIRSHLIQYSKIFIFTVLILSASLISWKYLIQHSRFVSTSHLIIPVVQLSGVEELQIPEYFWLSDRNKNPDDNPALIQLNAIINDETVPLNLSKPAHR